MFAKNFTDGLEIGASFAAYYNGLKVVDLWGGIADPDQGTPWEEDTITLVFSTTKGVTAMCANKLAKEGKLDLDAPVVDLLARVRSGRQGEHPGLVSAVASSRARLGRWRAHRRGIFSWDPVVDLLAEQTPHWEPGSRHGYHAATYGWLVGEVVESVSGMSVGAYLRHSDRGTARRRLLDRATRIGRGARRMAGRRARRSCDPGGRAAMSEISSCNTWGRTPNSAGRCSRRKLFPLGTRRLELARDARRRSPGRGWRRRHRVRSRGCMRRASAMSTDSASSMTRN